MRSLTPMTVLRRTVPAVLLIPLVTVLPSAIGTATPTPTAVTPTTHRAAMLPPNAPAVGDGDVVTPVAGGLAARQAATAKIPATGLRVVSASAPQPVRSDVAVLGVVWTRGTGVNTVLQYRTRAATGPWTPWQSADVDAGAKSDEADPAEAKGQAGSDPIVITGASQVQARLLAPRVAGTAPAKAQISVIDPGTSAADATVGASAAGSAAAAPTRPVIYRRAQWGADESIRPAGPSYRAVKGVVIHHTAGTNNYSSSQVPAILRGIYAYHVRDRKFNDIGYNFLVDKYGRAWEGRYGGMDRAVVGAQAAGYNSSTMGISWMGNSDTAAISTGALDTMSRVIAWKAFIHEFHPQRVANLAGSTFSTLIGHRQVAAKSCPGTNIWSKMGTIRTKSAAYLGYHRAQTVSRDVDNQMGSDVLALGADRTLFMSTATRSGTMSPPRRLASGGWGYQSLFPAGDMDRDGDVDLIARDVLGNLYVIRGNGTGGFSGRTRIGWGFNTVGVMASVGDMTGDGIPDLVAVNKADGHLRLYPGNGTGGVRRSLDLSGKWRPVNRIAGIGDWNGDGARDFVGLNTLGTARIYYGNGKGGLKSSSVLAGPWSQYVAVSGVSDTDGDGRTEFLVVDASGTSRLVKPGASGIVTVPGGARFAGMRVFGG